MRKIAFTVFTIAILSFVANAGIKETAPVTICDIIVDMNGLFCVTFLSPASITANGNSNVQGAIINSLANDKKSILSALYVAKTNGYQVVFYYDSSTSLGNVGTVNGIGSTIPVVTFDAVLIK